MGTKNRTKLDPRGGSNRHRVKTDFFQKWSNEMAYVLGFLYADGSITDARKTSRTQYIQFASKDRDILINIKAQLEDDPNKEQVLLNRKFFKTKQIK